MDGRNAGVRRRRLLLAAKSFWIQPLVANDFRYQKFRAPVDRAHAIPNNIAPEQHRRGTARGNLRGHMRRDGGTEPGLHLLKRTARSS